MRRVMTPFKGKREAPFAHIAGSSRRGAVCAALNPSRIIGVVRAFAPLVVGSSSIRPSLLIHSTQPVPNLPVPVPGAPRRSLIGVGLADLTSHAAVPGGVEYPAGRAAFSLPVVHVGKSRGDLGHLVCALEELGGAVPAAFHEGAARTLWNAYRDFQIASAESLIH